MTPGVKTSEFLVSIVPSLFGLLLICLGVFKGPPDLIQTGMWLLLGGAGGYTISRGIAKIGGAASAPADDQAAADKVAAIK